MSPLAAKNTADTPVYPVTLSTDPQAARAAVTAGSIAGVDCALNSDATESIYGIRDVKTDADGKLYFWLPEMVDKDIEATIAGEGYGNNEVTVSDAGNQSAVLMLLPKITSHTPLANATNVAIDTDIVLTFSKAMDTIKGGDVSDSGALFPEGTWSDDSKVYTVTPPELAYNTDYDIGAGGFVDTDGLPAAAVR
ncbi:Ig-like domain-containing protein, partial [Eubacteriales bacterium OttesenSCG-928-K08]|nr:Ig-like domain-containing protein [Eubacteriales bacterium OttesenSCG-928-K08]